MGRGQWFECQQFKTALSIRPFVTVMGIYLCSWVGLQVTAAILQYYVIDYMGLAETNFTKMILAVQGTALLMMLFWSKVAQRYGKRLVYCTDTTGDTSPEHSAWIERADVLLHECYFRDSASEWALKTGHSWTSRVIEIVQASRPKRLLLTHVNPLETLADPVDAEKMQDTLDAEVTLAEDHMIVDF